MPADHCPTEPRAPRGGYLAVPDAIAPPAETATRTASCAAAAAEGILRALASPFLIGNEEVAVSASIGIAIGQGARFQAQTLLREADAAMYRAKAAGKARYAVHGRALTALAAD